MLRCENPGNMCWSESKSLIDRLAEASRDRAPIDRFKAKGRMRMTTQTLTSAASTLALSQKAAL